jgi:hypothetical protein
VLNSVFAGVLFLVAAFVSDPAKPVSIAFWIALALTSFTASLWIKAILARVESAANSPSGK